jgi:hypothetical protein
MKLLLVEDVVLICESIRDFPIHEGYLCEVAAIFSEPPSNWIREPMII